MFLTIPLFILSILSHVQSITGKPFILPQGTGPFHSTLTVSELTDHSRPDPFNTTHLRRIMTSRFDPLPRKNCKLTRIPYFTPITAAVENEILGTYEFPPILDQFALEVCKKKPGKLNHRGKFPLAIFSPALNTSRLFFSSLAQEIASHGFTVITIDHPYDVDVVDFPNGDVIYGGRVIKPADMNGSTESVEHALDVRAQDVSFVLDTLGVGYREDEKVVMFGQSFGGAAVATAMLRDTRIRAGVNLDGMMFGPVLHTPLGSPSNPQSFLLWGSDGHNSTTDPTWSQFWSNLENSPNVDYKKELTIVNSGHGSYWDLHVMVDVAGIRDQLSETAQLLFGPDRPGTRVWEVLGRYLSSFFWFGLGLRGEDEVFRGPSKKFPEVRILRG